MHGNSDFKSEKVLRDNTGLARRFLKFPCYTIPDNPDPTLEATFRKDRMPFILWALGCPLPCDCLIGGRVITLTEHLNQEMEDDMKPFVLECVGINPEASTPVGAKDGPPPGSLYAAYRRFCHVYEYEPCPLSHFPEQLLITLQSLKVVVTKERANDSRSWKGISLIEGNRVEKPGSDFIRDLETLGPNESYWEDPEKVETSVALVEEPMGVLPLPETEQPKSADREEKPPSKEEADSPILDRSEATEGVEPVNPKPDEEIKASSLAKEKKPKGKHGGARPNAGRPKGSGTKTKKT